ncbi:uncharacterized protein LOC103824771 isoform X2 [Serinus canaria]|uniref:uncharacterized protein LOC103824771 isoform X2 n=1 Tax=Serinus canaria TaxID=9135 RepID=UPI0021CCC063|nr:uncharacterized protein LOC103824771 isoform X2 [Serinus canaria]
MGGGELPSPPGPFSFPGALSGLFGVPASRGPPRCPRTLPDPGSNPRPCETGEAPPLPHPLDVSHFLLATVCASHGCPALLFAPPPLGAPPLARTDWSGVMSLPLLLCVHWVELLSITQLRQWRRWRPFWSRARGRTQRRERRASPLPAMAAPLGTGAFTEETGQEKQGSEKAPGLSPERAEEEKLKAKYPNLGQKPGGSDFLMKRLQKGARLIIQCQGSCQV